MTQTIKVRLKSKSNSGRDRLKAIIVFQGNITQQQNDNLRNTNYTSKSGNLVIVVPENVNVKVYLIK